MAKLLEPHGIQLTNLTTDLEDGIAWFKLLESLTGKRLKGYHQQPTQLMMKLDNLSLFLRTLAFFGISLTGISPEGAFWSPIFPKN